MTDTLKITAADLDEHGFYMPSKSIDFEGHIEIAAGLGVVGFHGRLMASGRIIALAGSGIEAGEGIEAGWGIEAGKGIKAGEGIEAGTGIKAGEGIEAGEGIKAGWGIKAKTLTVRLRIFAGLCMWRMPRPEEMQIRAQVLAGTVAYGTVVEPKRSPSDILSEIRAISPEASALCDELEGATT